jgi:O-antigen/teichoic acid export membrane protein
MVKRALLINLGAVVASAIVGVISTVVLARLLGPGGVGQVMLLLFVFNLVSLLDIARPVLVHALAGQYEAERVLIPKARRALLAIGVLVGCLSLFSLPHFTRNLSGPEIAGLSVAVFSFFPMSASWAVLDSRSETTYTGLARSVGWISIYVAFVLCARSDMPFTAYAFLLAAMNLSLWFAFVRKVGALRSGQTPGKRAEGGFGKRVFDLAVFNLAGLFTSSLDRIVLASLRPVSDFGLFSTQHELTTKPAIILRSIYSVLLPRMAAQASVSQRPVAHAWITGLSAAVLATLLLLALAIAFREKAVTALLGEEFRLSADLFGLLLAAQIFVILEYACPLMLNAIGNFSVQRDANLLGATIAVIVSYPLIDSFGVMGAAILYVLVHSSAMMLLFRTLLAVEITKPTSYVIGFFVISGSVLSLAWGYHIIPALLILVVSAGLLPKLLAAIKNG